MNTKPAAIDNPVYQANLAAIAMGENGMFITCPHCNSRAVIRTSRTLSPLTREAYCQCINLACGHTFKSITEIVETLSPSAVPNPEIAEKLAQTKRLTEPVRPYAWSKTPTT